MYTDEYTGKQYKTKKDFKKFLDIKEKIWNENHPY